MKNNNTINDIKSVDLSKHPLYTTYTIDIIFHKLYSFYKKYFLPIFIFSFITSLITVFLTNAYIDIDAIRTTTEPEEMADVMSKMITPILGLCFISIFFMMVLCHFIIYKPLDESTTILTSLGKSASLLVPFIISLVLYFFAMMAAFILGFLVFIAGAFFTTAYMFVVGLIFIQVLLVEGPSIGNAISRSFKMVHKSVLNHIGWVLVLTLIYITLSFVLSGIISLPFAGEYLRDLWNSTDGVALTSYIHNPLYLLLSAATTAILRPLFPIFGVMLYLNGIAHEDASSKNDEVFTEFLERDITETDNRDNDIVNDDDFRIS